MDHSPDIDINSSWLFDDLYYRKRYADLTDEALEQGGFTSAYDHFRRVGDKERRAPGLFFDPDYYLSRLPESEADEATEQGPLAYYVRKLIERVEERTSIYFDPAYYRARYAADLASGLWLGALHHYLTNATPSAFDPVPDFSEDHYLSCYPDIARAVEAGEIRNGYIHFLLHGAREYRSPHPAIDLAWYADHNPRVRADLTGNRDPDAFTHLLRVGRPLGLPVVPLPEDLPSQAEGAALFRLRARALIAAVARRKLDFSYQGEPAVSVVMATHDRLQLTLTTLTSLRSTFSGPIELILLDLASHDETRLIERFVDGIRLLRFDDDVEPFRARNAAVGFAGAPAVLLLDDSLELAPGALSAALSRLSDPTIGAVGAMIIEADGRLNEAGGIIARDGTCHHYMRGALPIAPEANFVRDVDFCSSLFLLLRTSVFTEIGGFDETLAECRGEDPDLCLRIAQAGSRVVYDPAVQIYHHAGPEQYTPAPAPLLRKHYRQLRNHPLPEQNPVFARSAGRRRKRILFIDDTVPVAMLGSGFVRSRSLIARMSALGYAVTVFPLGPVRIGSAVLAADTPDDVEVLSDRSINDLEKFLHDRQGFYDAVWIARTHNLNRVRSTFESVLKSVAEPPLLILDTEAIAAARRALQAKLTNATFNMAKALETEFRNASICQRIVAVNNDEAELLRSMGLPDVTVIGHLLEPRPTPAAFADRTGMLFLGAIHETGSPNHDSLVWFIDHVLSLIDKELGWETRLTIAGFLAPGINLEAWQNHARITLRGPVGDPEPLYDAHRIFVAPTRFAAGVPYKIHEAASHGVPTVATTLLAQQLGWTNEVELLSADAREPEAFAAQIVRLYRDENLWSRLREAGLARVASDTKQESTDTAIREILGPS